MKNIYTLMLLFLSGNVIAQNVGINNTNPTSALDINGGIRLRPVTTIFSGSSVSLSSSTGYHFLNGSPAGNFTISFSPAPDEGKHTIISNTTAFTGNLFGLLIPPATTVELFYSNGGWKQIGSSQPVNNTAWTLSGNTGTDTALHFIGTRDNEPLVFKINNQKSGIIDMAENTALGRLSMPTATIDAAENTAIGSMALKDLVDGYKNTAVGAGAALSLKHGTWNVAVGHNALILDTAGSESVAVGGYAMAFNQNREGNTAVGHNAMLHNSNPDLGVITPTQGLHNTALGYQSLFNNRSGSGAVALGYKAAYADAKADGTVAIGRMALYNNNNREDNTAVGDSALFSNGAAGVYPAGISNTAIGAGALLNNSVGYSNTALGVRSLTHNINGTLNTAVGVGSLTKNVSGDNNTALGHTSLDGNESGDDNIAIGHRSLQTNTSGNANVAIGVHALNLNSTQSYSVAIGDSALYWNGFNAFGASQAHNNTALGSKALFNNRSGAGNVAVGFNAGFNESGSNKLYVENSVANKDNALIYGDFAADSLLLNAKTINRNSFNIRGNNPLELGYGVAGKQTDAGKICYGCFGDPANWLGIVGGGTNAAGNDRVIKLWSEGGLRVRGNALPDTDNFYTLGSSSVRWKEVWTNAGAINTSDARLKTNIAVSPYGLNEIMKMKPVQYNWKTNPDKDSQIGFLAQDIQKIIPEAVVVPENGDALGMKYSELIPVLVKAIQEQQQKIDELEKIVKALQK